MLELEKNRIYFEDCMEGMKKIPDGSIDCILCDLPYSITNNKWDSIIPLEDLWKEYERVIKENGAIVLTASQPFTSLLIQSNPKLFRYEWIWVKNKSTGHLNAKKMPLRRHESVVVFYKKLPVYNPQKTTGHKPVNTYTKHSDDGSNYGKTKTGIKGGGQTDRYPTSILEIPVMNNDDDEKFHPTQKPVALMEYMVRTYTNEGDTVLDTCMGSMTTAIACLNTGRNYIGFENNEEYYEKGMARIHNHKK